jgi:hypothetical protein
MGTKIAESVIKATWQDRLQICQNQGQGVWLRLNSGFILPCRFALKCPKAKLYKVDLAPKGTSDLVLIQKAIWIETKKTGEGQNNNQIKFEELVTGMGMPYLCPDSTDTSQLEEIL